MSRDLRRALPLVALVLCACTVGPNYERPADPLPTAWRMAGQEMQATADTAWWERFGDPALGELIREALAKNHDLRIAVARVDEYLGRYGVARSSQFPAVNGGAGASRQQVSRLANSVPDGVSPRASLYNASLSASWELDLWGRLRRGSDAARADLLAVEEARRGVVLTLVTAVANSYLTLRFLDRQLDIAYATQKSRGESLRIFDLRYKGGLVSELELAQSRSEYAQTLAAIPRIQAQISAQENALSLLLGRDPGPIARGKEIDAIALPPIPAGLPSDLLLRRPDLRQAEQQLVAANARIGVAQAEYFPKISLTAALGTASPSLSSLFSGPAGSWSYGAALVAPIFNAGAIAGGVAQATAQQEQALEGYRKSIQAAFRDVNDALTGSFKAKQELAALSQQIASLRTYARLARLRYDNGYTSYIEVLDSERSLFNAELDYATAQGNVLTAVVTVYSAMGGGWIDVADALSPPSGQPDILERAARQPLF